ncbi:UNVERIFIED_ORG: hypothetical protein EDF86_1793 [Pseudomonas psychrophila]
MIPGLVIQSERRLTAAEFQQLAEVLAAIEWFANFEIRTDGFGSIASFREGQQPAQSV